ncbi:MAG: sialate O-acetylesterase [Fuerstiella sp.]|nr:sialate O-acetylesterase [Fuerstiella sp.]
MTTENRPGLVNAQDFTMVGALPGDPHCLHGEAAIYGIHICDAEDVNELTQTVDTINMNSIQNPLSRMTLSVILSSLCAVADATDDDEVIRVFIFAGQSNMVGSDSKVDDIKRFPPFAGLENPQSGVRFSYCIGRQNKSRSDGWVNLQPVNNVVGPELSFARKVTQNVAAPIAIIKCAAGGTHLGGDWNPEQPEGFRMYPLALDLIRTSLRTLDEQNIAYRIEGFMWHQGENDMFNEDYMASYGTNLAKFLVRWRHDLKTPDLKFYIGELCTKTIWGMDLRPRMYAISQGQKTVTDADELAEYIPTSHVGVEIGGGVGLHYHYGTLGQLEHGVNYADGYLRTIGRSPARANRTLQKWPYKQGSPVKLFVLAGHRNMEGERAFVQELKTLRPELLKDNQSIAYRYSIGGGNRTSGGWEPLGPAGYYDTFGPEVSFADTLDTNLDDNIAIAKFTHSGSQMNDWTPEGSMARARHLYPQFITFIRDSVKKLKDEGHEVELAGIFYHAGENEMSMPSYRKNAATWLESTITSSRKDLELPQLKWYVSQQSPTDHERVNSIDVTSQLETLATADSNLVHIKTFDLPEQPKQLVLDTAGILRLGEVIAETFLQTPSR